MLHFNGRGLPLRHDHAVETCPRLPVTNQFDPVAARQQLHRAAAGRQFQGGASNPTFLLTSAEGRRYVLRKKPPGQLLASAHQVDREYRVMKALEGQVPVPRMRALCEDPEVIGTPFYVMDYLAGRIFRDATLPGLAPSERAAIYDDLNATLARLHQVDFEAVGLGDRAGAHARALSTGQRKRLELARALATAPRLLLLDEVTGGVDQATVPALVRLVRELHARGLALIVIEHNMRVIMEISERIVALQLGEVIAHGTPAEIVRDRRVIDAYLGEAWRA